MRARSRLVARSVQPVALPIRLAGAALAVTTLWLGGMVAVGLPVATAGGATPSVPYSDPRAAGDIGLCNEKGQQIASGSINSPSFVSKAVSTTAAESSVSGSGRTATLYAFQPIKGEDPAYWSGEPLTGASVYSNTSAPTAVSTNRDPALSNFLAAFPASWDGFLQLRMYLGAPGQSPYVATYPTLNVYVSGQTWQAVGGGTVNCNSGQAVSDEVLLGVPGAVTTTTTTTASVPANTSHTATSTPPAQSGASPDSASSAGGGQADAAADLPSHDSSSTGAVIAGVVAAAVVIGLGTLLLVRYRRRVAK
jgi:hypothetical protein